MEGWSGERRGEKRGMNRITHWDPAVHSSRCKGRKEGGRSDGEGGVQGFCGMEKRACDGFVGRGGNIWVAFTKSYSLLIRQ